MLRSTKVDQRQDAAGHVGQGRAARAAARPALVVPRGAVRFDEGTRRARPARDGELRDVELGACDAQGCAVDEGLADGDGVQIGGAP